MTNQKIRLGNQQPLQGRLARETYALTQIFQIGINNMIKDQFGFIFVCKSVKLSFSKK